ncbi:MAG: hypothetical protein WC404_03225 [Candidatus Omnitrophota bacterium]|jgi:hypothetical protein
MTKRIDLSKIKTIRLNARKCKVTVNDFAHTGKKGSRFADFYDSLPDVLAAKSLKAVVNNIVAAHKKKKMVILMMGAHVIKCGLAPLIIDLMKRGVIKAIALNGAGIIHDTEVAMIGRTSEDVGEGIVDGSFGMAEETASFINGAINYGFRNGLGIGEALGSRILKSRFSCNDRSILSQGYKLGVPVTVHVAVGTDIIHQHPSAVGMAIGEGSLLDFKNFIYSVSKLEGGVAVNAGSAVILPEVFLKAVTVARNLGYKIDKFTTANFDMMSQYRPHQNVITRPTSKGGKGYNIIGHHEIMLPLLYRSIIEKI